MKITNECRAELIDSMGSDLSVVNAARVSFDKESDWNYEWVEDIDIDTRTISNYHEPVGLKQKDTKLISYLARHGHFTPFTHCTITLRETVPIFVARQRFKHVVGFAYNEVSRRYVDDEPEFFVPDEWRGKPENAKQGSGEILGDETQHTCDLVIAGITEDSLADYQYLLELGVCPEQARMILPQNMMTSYYVTGSLYAFARAYNLRADSHAQKEIQDLAAKWNEIIGELYPVSWKYLTEK